MKKIIILLLLSTALFSACNDLDILPKNTITDDDLLTNDAGMGIYLATMYSHMPFEDFKYMGEWGFNYSSWLGATGIDGTGEALNRDGICRPFTSEGTAYWGIAFEQLRRANYLLETLPQYQSLHTELMYNHYLGEAYFVRAFVFYAMARRFGGVPLVTRVIDYPAVEGSVLEEPRASEEETWNQILNDFDKAAGLLDLKSPKQGYANKYVALAWKAEAMLYAGSVAKYNETVLGRLTGVGQKTGVRVIGFAENSWQEASKKYFTEAYKAAREVMRDGGYSLYKKKWSATDREAQYQNMVDMFSDLTSLENIYVRQYVYPTLTHGYDAYSCPFSFRTILAGGTAPTLDFLELFDGFERYANGTVKVTTGASNTEGEYLMYDKPMDFFKNAEPRLRAYVIFPGDVFKGRVMDMRTGIYTGPAPVAPLFNDYSFAASEAQRYQNLNAYTGKDSKTLYLSAQPSNQDSVVYNSVKMPASGADGIFFDNGEAALSGFYGRKWLNPDPGFVAAEGKSEQPFILMRYADVLLNAAEAAVELSLAGAPSPDGSDMLQVATTAINDIRERAGAELLVGNITSTEEGRNTVRRERRKELAFEHKTKWDLRRWRVQHYEGRDGFWGEVRNKDTYSDNTRYRFRGLYPFFSTETGKYFFDAHFQMVAIKTFSYSPVDYYFEIPNNEVAKSSVIDQQPNR